MLNVLHWLVPSVFPGLLLLALVIVFDRRREPPLAVFGTYFLGALASLGASFIEHAAGQAVLASAEGALLRPESSLVICILVLAPFREAAKILAALPVLRTRPFDEAFDGIVYAVAAALGFATLENASVLRAHPVGFLWIVRVVVSTVGHAVFASIWGYALGRSTSGASRRRAMVAGWSIATVGHALYMHLVFGRGAAALLATGPVILAMVAIVFVLGRDLRRRKTNPEARLSVEVLAQTAGFEAVREALRRGKDPLVVRWVVAGMLVTLGAMVLGLVSAVAIARAAHVEFSRVSEHDVTTAGPVLILVAGVLAAFPVSGFLVARASDLPTVREPALATAGILVAIFIALALAAPVASAFVAAGAPVAFALACTGAWLGKSG